MTTAERLFDELREQAFAELMNISFGSSVAAVSELIGAFIEMGIPSVEQVSVRQVLALLRSKSDATHTPRVVRQGFFPTLRGEAWMLFYAGVEELSADFGLEPEHAGEVVIEMSNILVSACLGRLSELLGVSTSFAAPRLYPASELFADVERDQETLDQKTALLVHTAFRREEHEFRGVLVLMLAEEAIPALRRSIDQWIEEAMGA